MNDPKWYHAQVIANCFVAAFAAVTFTVVCLQYLVLREANRPSVAAGFRQEDGGAYLRPDGELRSELVLINSSKAATTAYVRSTMTYSLEEIDAPSLPETESRILVWAVGLPITETIIGPTKVTEGQVNDIQAGRGYMYMRTHIRYGREGQYHTAICSVQRPKPTPGGPQTYIWERTGLCKDPQSNGES